MAIRLLEGDGALTLDGNWLPGWGHGPQQRRQAIPRGIQCVPLVDGRWSRTRERVEPDFPNGPLRQELEQLAHRSPKTVVRTATSQLRKGVPPDLLAWIARTAPPTGTSVFRLLHREQGNGTRIGRTPSQSRAWTGSQHGSSVWDVEQVRSSPAF